MGPQYRGQNQFKLNHRKMLPLVPAYLLRPTIKPQSERKIHLVALPVGGKRLNATEQTRALGAFGLGPCAFLSRLQVYPEEEKADVANLVAGS